MIEMRVLIIVIKDIKKARLLSACKTIKQIKMKQEIV